MMTTGMRLRQPGVHDLRRASQLFLSGAPVR